MGLSDAPFMNVLMEVQREQKREQTRAVDILYQRARQMEGSESRKARTWLDFTSWQDVASDRPALSSRHTSDV